MASRPFQAVLNYQPLGPNQGDIRLLEVYPAFHADEPFRSRLVNVRLTESVDYIGLSLLYGDTSKTEAIYVNGRSVKIPMQMAQALRNVRTTFTAGRVLDDLFSGPKALGPNRLSALSNQSSSHQPSMKAATASSSATTSSSTESGREVESVRQKRPLDGVGWKKAGKWLRNTFRLVRGKRLGGMDPSNIRPLRIWIDALCTNGSDADEMNRRRSHTALAYQTATLVVGWVGPKDEEADLAVAFLTTLADAAPSLYGDPKHRKDHPEQCEY